MLRMLMLILCCLMLLPVSVFGQSYSSLWKQADEANEKDLPQTRMEILNNIEAKAIRGGDNGQLMKAVLAIASQQAMLSPDSLLPAVKRLEKRQYEATDKVQNAVYCAVLSRIYRDNAQLSDSSAALAKHYISLAMANPAVLASTRAAGYKPFVLDGINSNIFDNDMLSVVGFETEQYEPMLAYYNTAGNRRAVCIVALKLIQSKHTDERGKMRKSHCIMMLDSLLAVYGDLEEAGEVAVERYRHMKNCTDVTVEDQIKYINYATMKWPSWQRMNELRNEYKRLTFPRVTSNLSTNTNNLITSNLSLRNIDELTMRVYRTSLDGRTQLNPQDENDYNKMKDGLQLLAGKTVNKKYSVRPDYEFFNDTLFVEGLEPGVYMVELTTMPETETLRMKIHVSNIRLLAINLPDNKVRYVVVDAQSGKPVGGAKIELRQRDKEALVATLTTDGNGEAVYAYGKEKQMRAYAYTDTDKALQERSLYGSFYANETKRTATKVKAITDRAIYRPGQTVEVAAVVYEESLNSMADQYMQRKVVAGKTVKAILRDANYKVVAEKMLVTDAYGKCNTTFVLPQSALNGRYSVVVDNTTVGISVEEYKRPTFFVEFPEIKETYRAGDTLVVRGKAVGYNGMPVQGATVKYSVNRSAWWWRYASDDNGVIASNEITTTAIDGTFAVEIPLIVPDAQSNISRMYHFNVSADVTDVSGETQQGQLTLPLGTKPVMLSCSLGEQVLADTLKGFTFTLHNAVGNEIDGEVEYYIRRCGDEEVRSDFYRSEGVKELRSEDNSLSTNNLSTKTNNLSTRQLVNLSTKTNNLSTRQLVNSSTKTNNLSTRQLVNLSTASSGRYLLTAWSGGDTLKHEFTVFSLNDTVPAAQTDEWFYLSAEQFPANGSPVTIQVGSSDPDLYIHYTIISGNRIIESGMERRNASLINRQLTYKKEYGNGLTLCFAWVKNGKCHNRSMKISRPKQDTDLKMAWKTFRNKLVPGQKEEWTLSITKSDGSPADAQMVLAMYDKSLDKLRKNQWSKVYDMMPALSTTHWLMPGTNMGLFNITAWQKWKPLNYQQLEFSCFDHSLFPVRFVNNGWMRLRGTGKTPVMMKSASATELKQVRVVSEADMEEFQGLDAASLQGKIGGLVLADDVAGEETLEKTVEESGYMQPQLRENLNETAFFYPSLTTDKDGNVAIKFTLPESVTTWRLIGFAHTADMLNNVIEAEAVASKEVMVQPNIPRFVRVGDEVQISVRISNSGEEKAKGNALMELVDPETNKVVVRQKKAIAVEAGGTLAVTFDYAPDDKYSLLICRITVSGKTFSDGEQHYLPVLPDKERITISKPFYMNDAGTKVVELNLSTKKITIEYTDNPAWLVIQAMPTLATPRTDNAIDQATSLYVNVLGRQLMNSNPRIKTAVALWQSEQGEETTMQSSLSKNQELKDILINETPWVADADNEEDQKQMLASFFDENTIEGRVLSAIKQLDKLQNADGSWSWCPDMRGNRYVTTTIAEMLVRLNKNAGKQTATAGMLDKVFGYLGNEAVEQVKRLKEREEKKQQVTFPDLTTLQYLYICAMDGRKLTKQVHEANDYLIRLLKKDIKNQTIYEKALTAIVLAKNGKQKESDSYVESLRQYTVYTDEQGRYYDTPRAGYSWRDYRIPTQVAAIEAIASVEDKQTVSEMQRWLLQQKRTQAWDTPLNSVDAVYTFMNGNDQLLDAQPQAKIYVDNKAIEQPKATAAIGYIKTKVDNVKAKTIKIEKSSAGTSWGTVYMQCNQNISEIENNGSGIVIKREIIGQTDSPITVGSRVTVRITIEASRNLDFVQISDKRAACMEPVNQMSGYRNGAYCSTKDNVTHYFIEQLPKGKHVIETDYYIDRAGSYTTGTCTIECAYSPEFRAVAKSQNLNIKH